MTVPTVNGEQVPMEGLAIKCQWIAMMPKPVIGGEREGGYARAPTPSCEIAPVSVLQAEAKKKKNTPQLRWGLVQVFIFIWSLVEQR